MGKILGAKTTTGESGTLNCWRVLCFALGASLRTRHKVGCPEGQPYECMPKGPSSFNWPAVEFSFPTAQVVKLVDALASGASVRKDVKVRVLSWAPLFDCAISIADCLTA